VVVARLSGVGRIVAIIVEPRSSNQDQASVVTAYCALHDDAACAIFVCKFSAA
jgi:hypothetical protein